MNRVVRVGLLAGLLPLLVGCATYASIDNQPRYGALTQDDTDAYSIGRQRPGQHPDEITVALAFSGGGARAAALAYGVLLELRDTKVPAKNGSATLLDEVDAISAVSGGSFTAAYYGLHGDATFPAFEQQVLRRDLNADLLRQVLNPLRWFTPQGRSAAAAQLYGRTIFQGARFADLQKRNGPLVIINASDLESGNRFAFLQGQFDLLCSDLLSFPIADAVAASSAVPVLFEPVVLQNYATCSPAKQVSKVKDDESPQLQQAIDGLQGYRDKQTRRYIHLADGGLTDNLGLRAFQEGIDLAGGLSAFLRRIDRTPAAHMVVISVDSSANAGAGLGLSRRAPSIARSIDAMTDIQLQRYNAATLELMQDSLKQWTADVSTPSRPVQGHLVAVSLRDLPDTDLRARLEAVPTGFSLSPQQVDELVDAGRRLLREHPQFQALLQALGP
ncbi:patatin-like phospholipase family protein [Thermomonas sp.]|uniref:patatin-like phospholipase family protein n=1 Tax=Thermomonas sp. TaxID=1971895 RepID=UPI00248A80D3|nr:patatin-like phospholipase family protein [Thermomonas sp.]MDI1252237.1 patatin-like phospholipase family protein [Thermomonas sp.]